MKPIYSYYGGKQRMAPNILPILNAIPHKVYVEPFCGGATMFWGKAMHTALASNQGDYREIINDKSSQIVNFFRVCRDPEKLKLLLHKLTYTPYSREEYSVARDLTESEDDVELAWAWFVNCEFSYANKPNAGYGYGIIGTNPMAEFDTKVKTHIANFDKIVERLKLTFIENLDAVECMSKYDSENTLHVCDPPYINTEMGYYKGYTVDDYKRLLDFLNGCKGSFILSGYPNEYPPADWPYYDFQSNAGSANGRNGKGKGARVERLWVVRRGGGIGSDQTELF